MKTLSEFLELSEAVLGGEKYRGKKNPNSKPLDVHGGALTRVGFVHTKTTHSREFDEPPTTHHYEMSGTSPVNARARAHRALIGSGFKKAGTHGTTTYYEKEAPDKSSISSVDVHHVKEGPTSLKHHTWVFGQRNKELSK